MLLDDVAAYATLVVQQPILVFQVANSSQNFPMNVISFGDVTEALSPVGMRLDKCSDSAQFGKGLSRMMRRQRISSYTEAGS